MPKSKRIRRLWLCVVRRTVSRNKILRQDDSKGVVVSYNLLPDPAAEHAFDILWGLRNGTILSDCTHLAQTSAAYLMKHKNWSSFASTLKEQENGARVLYYEPKVAEGK